MVKKILIILSVVLVVVVIILLVLRSSSSGQKIPRQNHVGINTVQISNFAFTPQTITIKPNTEITWVNEDSVVHTVVSDIFRSSNLNQGDVFKYTFTKQGTYNYRCSIHPSMMGKIIVQ